MAIYRTIQMSFWTDSKVDDEFTPEDKYFYLYLLTNPHTELSGCYEISMKQMSRETGYNEDTVQRLINRMERVHKVIRFSKETKEILIIHWNRYNWVNQSIKSSVEKNLKKIKNESFRRYLSNAINGIEEEESNKEEEIYKETVQYIETVTATGCPHTVGTGCTHGGGMVSESDIAFESFWKAYPRKIGKEAARKAFAKVKKSEWNLLVPAVEAQKRSQQWTKENGRYIPNPATWLNQGRWQDELTPAQTVETNNPFLAMYLAMGDGEE